MAVGISELETYLEDFTKFVTETAAYTPRWLRDLQETAFARFCAVGFPTTRDEDWRFTNLAPLARTPFRLPRGEPVSFEASELKAWCMEGIAARLVFVNAQFAPQFSTWSAMPEGVTVSSLHREIVNRPDTVAEHLGHYLNIERDPFCALNTAFAEDGAYVYVRRGVVIEQPIQLLFVSTVAESPAMTHPRNLIVVDEEGQASVIEEYVSIGNAVPAFSNAVTELVAGRNSTVDHMLIEREHGETFSLSTLRIEQAQDANVASHSLLLGGGLVRNNVHPVLRGDGGECLINGLFIGSGRQHLDNYMLVEHASPHCASRQFYNGILDDRAHGVFHGRIVVHKNAQRTDAKQTNRNLLLNDDAQIDTKPQLEIYADDVKCTHGATIGQIEEDALFYLRSRGIEEVEARQLLLQGFASECLNRIKPGSGRAYAESAVNQRLLQGWRREPIGTANTEENWSRHWGEIG